MPHASSMNDMAALNKRQKTAVTHRDGPLLVIAGAGSGKTRTLTHRAARLVEDHVPPHSILLLTFTRKAATEMLQRAATLLDHRCREIAGGTFHAFSNLLLRRYAKSAGLDPAYSILDRADMHHLITLAKKSMGITRQARAFPKAQTLARIFSMSTNKESPIEAVIENHFGHLTPFTEILCALFSEYTKHKARHRFLDYDDLLVYAKRLLAEHPEIRMRISSTYRYVMVDEYQDTNRIQAELLFLLAESHQNVMAVGDDSQSIYAFRGAEVQNILEFPKRFENVRILRLEENYRSVQPILNMTNAILEKAADGYPKRLFTQRRQGNTPCLIRAEDENTQSRFVVEKVRHLMGHGIGLDQMAVLFRSSFHSFDLEIELKRNNVPFVKVGGFQFAESAHVKDFLAHLKVLINPYDKLSWLRMLMLFENVGTKTAEKIYETLVAKDAGLSGFLSINDPLFSHEGIQTLQVLFKALLTENAQPGETGEALMRYYLPLLQENYEDHPKRARELEQMVGIMDRYTALEAFLTDMALEPPNTSTGAELYLPEAGNARLTLSTIHSAKGLEWHTVFIIYTLEGRFPSFQSIEDPAAREEELRLMYVAATRAKENLFFVYPQEVFDRGSGTILNRASPFLRGIDKTLLKRKAARTRPDLKASLRAGTRRYYNRRF